MTGINAGKVIVGGLVAGLVFNVIDFVINTMILAADFQAAFTRLGLDPAGMESASAITAVIVIDFLFGFLAVFTYAAIRPRFGAGAKTAVIAALLLTLPIALIMIIFTLGGVFTMGLYAKILPLALINNIAGTVAGAALYKEDQAATMAQARAA
jgi:hypothetical protein